MLTLSRILCALTILVTLVVAVPARRHTRSPVKIPTVRFCELTTHPERYLNKFVRTEASYLSWWESSYLYSESCKGGDHKVSNAHDCTDDDEACLKEFSSQWKKLKPYLRAKRNSTHTTWRVKAVFTGRLMGPGEFGHLGSFKYEFRIRTVERVAPIPKSIPW